MTDAEINAIIAQATTDNPAVRASNIAVTTTVTSEETVEDANAAFLEALGETEPVNLSVQMEAEHPETEEVAFITDDTSYSIQTTEDEPLEVNLTTISSREPIIATPVMEDTDFQEATEAETPIETEHIVIPPNSNSIEIDETTSRFSDAIWYNKIQEKVITLAGLGGIGSYVAFLLARMKPRAIYLYDDDEVEAANMSGQLYGKSDIGNKKANAATVMVGNYADYGSVFAMIERFTYNSEPSDIMICGFDNMEARRTFFDMWMKHLEEIPYEQRKHCLFIDGRLAAESIQVFCITGDDDYSQSRYRTIWLFNDKQADSTICSYKQTTFCANMIGSIMTNLFVNFCANECNPLIPRDLPFMTSYEAETMYFKTEN